MTRILPPTYLVIAIALTITLNFLLPAMALIPFPWCLFGLLPILAGIVLNITADNQFKRRQTTVKPFQASSALVTEGVFRWSRNPMYLGMVLITSGAAIIEGSATPWIVVAALAVLLDRIFIAREEEMLQDAFGAAFQQYKKRVRRWL